MNADERGGIFHGSRLPSQPGRVTWKNAAMSVKLRTAQASLYPMKTDILLLAITIDLLFGDPPNRWHPTAWMGQLIGYAKARRGRGDPAKAGNPPGQGNRPGQDEPGDPPGKPLGQATPAEPGNPARPGDPPGKSLKQATPAKTGSSAGPGDPPGKSLGQAEPAEPGSPPHKPVGQAMPVEQGEAVERPRDAPHKAIAELAYGAGIVLGGMGLAAGAGAVLARLCARLPAPLGMLAEAALLKTTFSLRGLDRAAGEVQSALEAGDLPEARRALAWHLVSRDTSALDEALVAAAAVESVAENTSDGVIAPLFYYALGGLPAALAYRFANTADAMLGYHTAELEWLGKIPARLDDLLNLLPARLSGLLIALAAPLAGGDARRARQVMKRDARLTQSPNAGYPMSAMAGGLGVALEKRGHYKLGAGGRPATAADIYRARRTMLAAALLFAAAAAGCGRFMDRRLPQEGRSKKRRLDRFAPRPTHGRYAVERRAGR